MLFIRTWFSMSDVATEEAIYEIYSIRKFVGVDFASGEQAQDATTLPEFRHLLERNGVMEAMFDRAAELPRGVGLHDEGRHDRRRDDYQGALVREKQGRKARSRNALHKKGHGPAFRNEAHIGVDAGSGRIHAVACTAANGPDDELFAGDSGYIGVEKRKDFIETAPGVTVVRANKKPGTLRSLPAWHSDRAEERRKSSLRARVEHPFHIVKQLFGFKKTACRGISKNSKRPGMLFMSANLLMCAGAAASRPTLKRGTRDESALFDRTARKRPSVRIQPPCMGG
jgi:IS5 family transposase